MNAGVSLSTFVESRVAPMTYALLISELADHPKVLSIQGIGAISRPN
jgi:hypothetical protein